MNFKLKVWRQSGRNGNGEFKDYEATDIPKEASFLEMLDIVNEALESRNEEPIALTQTAGKEFAVCAHW